MKKLLKRTILGMLTGAMLLGTVGTGLGTDMVVHAKSSETDDIITDTMIPTHFIEDHQLPYDFLTDKERVTVDANIAIPNVIGVGGLTMADEFNLKPFKLTAKKKAIVVKWKKPEKEREFRIKFTDGPKDSPYCYRIYVEKIKWYDCQVQYSTKKNMKSSKTITIDNPRKITSTTIKKLKSKKTYYVRIRMSAKIHGKRVYSKWSCKQVIKTK